MPIGIFIFEIEKSFGPNILATYYLTEEKVTKEILQKLSEKHQKKNLLDATAEKEGFRYYSSKIKSKNIEKDNLFLGFILRENEDLISLKSVFGKIEKNIAEKFTPQDKDKLQAILKTALNSILSLMEKLKEPAVIQQTINDKTKKLLDEGKIQEAKELIDLGEDLPMELSKLIMEADEYYESEDYKKAKKRFIKAADLAKEIQEEEIVDFLKNKAETVGKFPDLIKERENLQKDIKDIFDDLEKNQLRVYNKLIDPIEKLLEIANTFEENERYEFLTDLLKNIIRASELADKLLEMDNNIESKMKEL